MVQGVVLHGQLDPVPTSGDVYLHGARVRVAGDVAQRLAQHGEQVIGQLGGHGVEDAGEPQCRLQAKRGGELGDHVEQLGPSPRRAERVRYR